jgi:hypothetical protein
MEGGEHDPFDTHPPLRERIAALGGVASFGAPSLDPRALTLVSDVPALEEALLVGMAGEETAQSLEVVSWDSVGPQVMQPAWAKAVGENSRAFKEITIASFPHVIPRIMDFARELKRVSGEPRDKETLEAKGMWHLMAALGHALARRGWSIESLPGEPHRLHRREETVDLASEIESLRDGQTTEEEWRSRVAAWGIADANLSSES